MKLCFGLHLIGGLLAVAIASAGHAQVADAAASVPIHFQGRYNAASASSPNSPASIRITPLGVSGASRDATGTSTGGTGLYTSGGFARLRPGKAYMFRIETYALTRVQVKITAPSGQRVIINGVAHEMFDWQMGDGGQLASPGFFTVRLDDGSGAPVGEAASVRPGRLLWSVGMGNLRNGKPAGSLRIAEEGVTAAAFTPAALYYDHDSGSSNNVTVGDDGEVTVVKAGNVLRQVRTQTVLADVVANTDHSYFIRFYTPELVGSPDANGVYSVSGTPLFEFCVENPNYPALDALRITKTTNQNGSLVMWTQMTKQIGQPSGTTQWLVDDWVEKSAGATTVSSPVRHRWTYSDGERNEHLRVERTAGEPVYCVFKRYDDINFEAETSRELTYEITGCNSDPYINAAGAATTTSIKTSYTYQTAFSDANAGNWHKIYTTTSNDGSLTIYDYRNEFEQRGFVYQVRRPYKNNNPSLPGLGQNGEITTYNYDFPDNFGVKRLASMEVALDGKITAKSEFFYDDESVTDSSATYTMSDDAVMPVTKITRKDYYSETGYLTTTSRFYREDADPQYKFFAGLPYSVERPDKSMTVYVYYHGMFPTSTFTPVVGGSARVHTTVEGTSDATFGVAMTSLGDGMQPLPANFRVVAGKSRRSSLVFHDTAMPVYMKEEVYANGWSSAREEMQAYASYLWPSLRTRQANINTAAWTIANNTWTAGRLSESVDETGIVQTITYDSVGRVWTTTRGGATFEGKTIPAQTVSMSYDAAGRLLSRSTTDGTETLVSSTVYDTAGRITSQSESGRGRTDLVYDVPNRTVTITLPSKSTRIETRLLDGQLSTVTGTAQVGESYDYGVEPDGRRKTAAAVGGTGSVRTATSWVDRLGRLVQQSRPGFKNASTYTESMEYDSGTGQLVRQITPGRADTRFEYNGMGELIRRGLAISGGTLQPASSDRITDFDTRIESFENAYWLTSYTRIYPTKDSADNPIVETRRERLTGLSGSLRAETRVTGIDGTETKRIVSVDVASKLVTIATTRTGVSNTAVEKSVVGFPVSSTGFDGVKITRGYDSLCRLSTVTNPRTGPTTTTYYPNTPLVYQVQDAANNYVSTSYYDDAGRVTDIADAASKLVHIGYNTRGQVIRRWGPAAMPVEYAYNGFGERAAMRTFRTGDFTGTGWPLTDSGLDATGTPDPASWISGDKTTWSYDPYSGLLATKNDAFNRPTTYTYYASGQTQTRTWARNVITTYSYSPATGELTNTSYSDGVTHPIEYTYTRAGQIYTAEDATGKRTFRYGNVPGSNALQLDQIDLPAWYNSRQLVRNYDAVHRPGGFTLGSQVSQIYGYQSDTGLFGGLTTSSNAQAARTFTYGYNTGGLVSTLTAPNLSVSYIYEDKRDLLTSIDTQWSNATRTRYDYTYDNIGRRRTAKQSCNLASGAFADFGNATTYNYVYNDRGELEDAADYLGSDVNNAANQLTGRHFAYKYDGAGNRKSSSRTGTLLADQYAANALNQYDSRENNVAHVAGTSKDGSSINVTGGTGTSGIGQEGRFWGAQVTLNNTNGPSLTRLTIAATLAGSSGLQRKEERTALLAKALQSFTYDEDGNLKGDGLWNYTYDPENRLIAVETDPLAIQYVTANFAKRLEFQYDYLNRRVSKRVLGGWNGTSYTAVTYERRYLYDGDNLVAELTGDGATVIHSYTWGLDVAGSLTATGGVGALVQITDHHAGVSYIPTYDGTGNVASLINTSTNTVAVAYEYSPFGEILRRGAASSGTPAATAILDNPFAFSTKFHDWETGLVYYGARYYSPGLGRFINRDPIEEAGDLSLYRFCGNNGVNGIDVLGFEGVMYRDGSGGNDPGIAMSPRAITMADRVAARVLNPIAGLVDTGLRDFMVWSGAWKMAAEYDPSSSIRNGMIVIYTDVFLKGRSDSTPSSVVPSNTAINPSDPGEIGTYLVRQNAAGEWRVVCRTNGVTTKYAFVNGILGDLGRHAFLGGTHLQQKYGADVKEFTLFNNPSEGFFRDVLEAAKDKLGFTTAPAKALALVLQEVQASGKSVEWIAHSQGGAIFAEAMRYAGGDLSANSVTFNAGANNSWVTNSIAADVGVHVGGYYYSPMDAVPNIVGMNGNPLTMLTSLLAAPLLFTKDHSPHTAPTRSWVKSW